MIRFAPTLLLAFGVLAILPNMQAQSERYQADLAKSTIAFVDESVDSKDAFAVTYGLITVSENRIEAATLVGEIRNADRDTQRVQFSLKTLNPIRSVEGGANFSAMGELQIEGKGQPISCPVRVHFDGNHVVIEGQFNKGSEGLAFHIYAVR
jgi:hypothetical protein|tara:strand:+ start:894 stop:1349 length:456 start_codon:yes stop_codon:yes gene_type:complete